MILLWLEAKEQKRHLDIYKVGVRTYKACKLKRYNTSLIYKNTSVNHWNVNTVFLFCGIEKNTLHLNIIPYDVLKGIYRYLPVLLV